MAGVQKVSLNNLNVNLKNALVIGIIIAKNSPKTIGSKKKNGESRGVMSFTIRDSDVDTINVNVWGTEHFVMTFYERFLIGDVVEISSPKINIKSAEDEIYRPQVSSPFFLSINEGSSDVNTFIGDTFGAYLPLLHIPSKASAGYCGLAEIMKFNEANGNAYVDLLVVVKAIKPMKKIKTKTGMDMSVRGIEIIDNTTPASLVLDMFDLDTIQRAEEWQPSESVLFIADARVSFGDHRLRLQVCGRTVITHQPYTPDAEALRIYVCNQTGKGEAASWAAWSGERACALSVAQIRDRLAAGTPFSASLHALLTHLDLNDLVDTTLNTTDELKVRFSDHTGELNARLPINILRESLGLTPEELKTMSADDRAGIRWRLLLEQCNAKLAVTPPRVIILSLRRATSDDPIPLN